MHYYNEGLVGHPMHLHSQPQLVIAKDGFPLAGAVPDGHAVGVAR
jgi:manganese oxidase